MSKHRIDTHYKSGKYAIRTVSSAGTQYIECGYYQDIAIHYNEDPQPRPLKLEEDMTAPKEKLNIEKLFTKGNSQSCVEIKDLKLWLLN